MQRRSDFNSQKEVILTISQDLQEIQMLQFVGQNENLTKYGLDDPLISKLTETIIRAYPFTISLEEINNLHTSEDLKNVRNYHLSTLFSTPTLMLNVKAKDIKEILNFLTSVRKLREKICLLDMGKESDNIKQLTEIIKLNLDLQINDIKHNYLLKKEKELIVTTLSLDTSENLAPLDAVVRHLATQVNHFEENSDSTQNVYSSSSYLNVEAIWQGLSDFLFSELKKAGNLDKLSPFLASDDSNYVHYMTEIKKMHIISDANMDELNQLIIKLTKWNKDKLQGFQNKTTVPNTSSSTSNSLNILIIEDLEPTESIPPEPVSKILENQKDTLSDLSYSVFNTCRLALIKQELKQFNKHPSIDELTETINARENQIKSVLDQINMMVDKQFKKSTKEVSKLSLSSGSKKKIMLPFSNSPPASTTHESSSKLEKKRSQVASTSSTSSSSTFSTNSKRKNMSKNASSEPNSDHSDNDEAPLVPKRLTISQKSSKKKLSQSHEISSTSTTSTTSTVTPTLVDNSEQTSRRLQKKQDGTGQKSKSLSNIDAKHLKDVSSKRSTQKERATERSTSQSTESSGNVEKRRTLQSSKSSIDLLNAKNSLSSSSNPAFKKTTESPKLFKHQSTLMISHRPAPADHSKKDENLSTVKESTTREQTLTSQETAEQTTSSPITTERPLTPSPAIIFTAASPKVSNRKQERSQKKAKSLSSSDSTNREITHDKNKNKRNS